MLSSASAVCRLGYLNLRLEKCGFPAAGLPVATFTLNAEQGCEQVMRQHPAGYIIWAGAGVA